MTIELLRKKVARLRSLCEDAKKDEKDFSGVRNPSRELFDFRARRAGYHSDLLLRTIKDITTNANFLMDYQSSNKAEIARIIELLSRLDDKNPTVTADICSELLDITRDLNLPKSLNTSMVFSIPSKIPKEISDEVKADIEEMKKCFDAGCFRSATILCGRVLETALHRKYFEMTGNDALEKSPGIGLGKLIAKLSEANVQFDPGITQQIHLINQTRIFTVHKQQTPFYPTKEQAQAIMLYTIDAMNKLF